MDAIPKNKSLAKPELTKRQQLDRLVGMKQEFVTRPVVKLDTFRNMKETEKLIRFRIEQEEKNVKR